ncbi:MAG: glycoside hydrolase family 99-like domain-containing protein, partial [Sedimentisphaerales bacterium]|nr:glycoside hydrolase family 99-like domain-containing protein [Sedimentisphaerales bacterium]
DTGWDSRPWHGDKSMVIQGRTPQLFEELLRQAKSFCEERGKTMLILGPVNEWGEGSYIEPCTEFGFEMLEAVRKVFATRVSTSRPVNVSPSDVGLGSYDFPPFPAGDH